MVTLSIATPVVSMNPGVHGPWEYTATIEDLARVAETADRLGYHHLTCSEHMALRRRQNLKGKSTSSALYNNRLAAAGTAMQALHT